MTIVVDQDEVREVLLADGWHRVRLDDGVSTFCVDTLQYACSPGEQAGFCFQDPADSGWIAGPLSSLLAVRYRL